MPITALTVLMQAGYSSAKPEEIYPVIMHLLYISITGRHDWCAGLWKRFRAE